MSKNVSCAKLVLLVAGCLFAGLAILLYKAYVVSVLWSYFMVPVGFPEITVKTTLGVGVIVGVFTYKADGEVDKSGEKSFPGVLIDSFLNQIIYTTFCWVFGYGYHLFL